MHKTIYLTYAYIPKHYPYYIHKPTPIPIQTHVVPLTAAQCAACLDAFVRVAGKYALAFTEIQVCVYTLYMYYTRSLHTILSHTILCLYDI